MTYANATTLAPTAITARLPKLALAAGLLTSASLPAFGADLNFDATCQNPTAISVSQPNTGITFRKNPNSSTTRAATATVQRGTGAAAVNIVIPAGQLPSCFYQVQGSYSYCFTQRGTADITDINAVPGTNTAGAAACQ